MSGKIESIKYVICLIALFTIYTDLRWGKIYNWFTVPVAILGIITSINVAGWHGALEAILGIFLGLLLYGWMFGLHIIGGGDVKLLMALGAWGGSRYTIEVAILGLFVGGVFSFFILLFSGRLVSFSKRMFRFLLSLFVKELEVQVPSVDRSLKMPFGVPISIAAVWTIYAHPLQDFVRQNFWVSLWP